MTYGETVKVENDWSAELEERGTTLSSSSWTSSGPTLGSTTTIGNIASALISGCGGCLVNTVVLANGETLVATREVFVP